MRAISLRLTLVIAVLVVADGASAQGNYQSYYTSAQAARGKALFDRHCSQCHAGGAFPPGKRPDAGDKGFWSGKTRTYQSLAAPYLKTAYLGKPIFPSVYFLYK